MQTARNASDNVTSMIHDDSGSDACGCADDGNSTCRVGLGLLATAMNRCPDFHLDVDVDIARYFLLFDPHVNLCLLIVYCRHSI